MKDLVNDTLWLGTEDGGEVKMSMGGYTTEEVERLIDNLTASGTWTLISHDRKTRKDRYYLPKWFWPWAIGFFLGSMVQGYIWPVVLTAITL